MPKWPLNKISELDAKVFAWECVSMIIVDQSQRIHIGSPLCCELLGYLKGELTGKMLPDLMEEKYRAQHGEHFKRFFDNPRGRNMGQGTSRHTFPALKKNGEIIMVTIYLNALAPEGEPFVFANILPSER